MSTSAAGERSVPGRAGVRGVGLTLAALTIAAAVAALALWPDPSEVLLVFPRRDLLIGSQVGAVLERTDILQQNGLEAHVEAPEDRAAFGELAERADVVITDETHALLLAERSGGARIVASLGSAGRIGLVVPTGSPITTTAELRGRRVAVPRGPGARRHANAWLAAAGLEPAEVELVEAGSVDQALSLGADATVLWDPALFGAEFRGTSRALETREHFTAVVFDPRLVEEHRDVGQAALTAIKQAMHSFNDDPRQAAIWLAGDLGKPAPQMQRACFRANGNFGWRSFVSLCLSPELPSFQAALEADLAQLVIAGSLPTGASLDDRIHGALMDEVDSTAEPLAEVGLAPQGDD